MEKACEVAAICNIKLLTEDYSTSILRSPKTGRHIIAQYDETSVVVYQAYRPAIAPTNTASIPPG